MKQKTMLRRKPAWALLACLAMIWLCSERWIAARPALAQTQKPVSNETETREKGISSPEDKTPQRSIKMKEVEIVGEVEKPKAMFVIPMAPVEYRRTQQGKDFTSEILAPIDREWIQNLERQIGPGSRP
jgi:hypothetical protein